jgi:hypothetical protein
VVVKIELERIDGVDAIPFSDPTVVLPVADVTGVLPIGDVTPAFPVPDIRVVWPGIVSVLALDSDTDVSNVPVEPCVVVDSVLAPVVPKIIEKNV